MNFAYLNSVKKARGLVLRKLTPEYHLLVYENIFNSKENKVSKLGVVKHFKLSYLSKKYPDNEYYHAVFFSQGAIQNGAYFLSLREPQPEDERFKNAALMYLEMLKSGMEFRGDTILFPYHFDFRRGKNIYRAPWYGGMAQGQALSAFAIGYLLTGENEYARLAESVILSFDRLYGRDEPWFVYIDELGYAWIEEYPDVPPTHVLNGFIYSVFGLYDALMFLPIANEYKVVVDDLISASIRTLLDNLGNYLSSSNHISPYDSTKSSYSVFYHMVHIDQLSVLWQMTGNPKFLEVHHFLKQYFLKQPLKLRLRNKINDLRSRFLK